MSTKKPIADDQSTASAMFDEMQLQQLLSLHEKSFALMRWVRASLGKGLLSFTVVHEASDSALAASEWIQRHLTNIPREARPTEGEVAAFSRLFVSFLTTSYRLSPNSARWNSESGCRCMYCNYLKAGPHLDARNPSKKDISTAQELKRIYLCGIASEIDDSVAHTEIDSMLEAPDLAVDLAMATWGVELLRRSEFASQGEAVLALWRQFAWEGNRAKKDFRLTAKMLMDSERRIVAAMKSR